MVNAELVRQGYAQVATVSPNVKDQELLLRLQREAREAGREWWGAK
jgi:micrococcal nuclease